MTNTPTDLSVPPLLGGLLLALLGGCGGDRDATERPTYRRLELRPVATAIQPRPARELRRWEDFDEAEGFEAWTIEASRHEVVDFHGDRVLKIARKQPARIEIPAPLRFARDARLRLSLFVQNEPLRLTARLLQGDREVTRTSLGVGPYFAEQEIVLRFPTPATGEWTADRIELLMPEGGEPTGVTSITVEDVPYGGELPESTFGDYGLIALGTDSLRATGLSSDHPLAADFEVTARGQQLLFSYGLPGHVRVPGRSPELQLTLRAGGGREVVHRFGFEENPDVAPVWHLARAPLDELLGESVTATFELPALGAPERLCALGRVQLCEPTSAATTVLLITSDTHRRDHVGFLAEEGWLRTETIDRLAAEGVAFTDALASINNTTPSHVALFTGLSPRDTGVVANLRRLADEAPTLAERFSELGFATIAAVSASPVDYRYSGLGQGFDRYSTPGMRSKRDSAKTLEELFRWLPDYRGVPLFVWVHLYDAHAPYEPPEAYERLYYPAELDPYDGQRPGADPSIAPKWRPEVADPKFTEALYRSEITYLDERLGELLELDRFAEATVAFTADHGEVLSRGRGLLFSHDGLSLDTLAVPLVFRHPGLPAGTRRDTPVMQVDVGRTLLNLAGHPEVEFPGRDLFAGEAHLAGPRFGIEANGLSASVVSEGWMLSFALRTPPSRKNPPFDAIHEVKLFDLEADPHCLNDLRDEHPDRVAKLRRLLVRWLTRSGSQDWEASATASDADIAKHLADLGYVSDGSGGAGGEWFDPECDCRWCERFR